MVPWFAGKLWLSSGDIRHIPSPILLLVRAKNYPISCGQCRQSSICSGCVIAFFMEIFDNTYKSFLVEHFLGKTIGFQMSYEINFVFFKRPSERNNPSLSTLGCNSSSLLFAGSVRSRDKDAHSSRNPVNWACLTSWTSAVFSSSDNNSPHVLSFLDLWLFCYY